MTIHRKRHPADPPHRETPALPAAMQALLHERHREATEPPDAPREGMPAALQARDNLRRRLGAG
jgi:hypothetical protein